MANEYIRHLTESGEWAYSNVITVGQLEALTTQNKTDLVSAINEMNNHFRLSDTTINDITSTIDDINLMLGNIKSDITDGQTNLNTLRGEVEARKLEVDNNISNVKNELDGKIQTSSTTIEEIKKKTAELQANFTTNAEKVDGVIVEIKNDLLSTNNELSNKLSKTEFDTAVGVNKWIATFYDTDKINYANSYPKVEDMATLQSSYVDEIDDSVELYPFTELKTGLLHLFTNVYLTTPKNIEINVSHTYGMAILMNGAYIYYKAGNGTQRPSMSLRKGWNTIEILLGVNNSVGRISLDTRISNVVNKMTTVIGVGGKDESRLTHNETIIKQTNEAISFKADNTVVEQLGNDVKSNTAQLEIQAGQIASKVERDEFNGYTGRLEQAETSITQTSEKIESLATKTSVDTLNNIVSNHETNITQLNKSIELKASKEEMNSVQGTVSTAVGKIEVLEGEVALKANKTELDTVSQTVVAHDTSIKANADEIALRASKTELENLEGRVGVAESSITANSEKIELKASKAELEQTTGKIGQIEASLQVAHDEISTKVSSIKYENEMTSLTERVEEISKINLEYWARHLYSSPLFVRDSTLPIYAESGLPNPPVGGVFNNVKNGKISGHIVTPATTLALSAMAKLYKHTKDERYKEYAITIGDFMKNHLMIESNFYGAPITLLANQVRYSPETKTWNVADGEVNTRSIYQGIWAFLDLYEITKLEQYKEYAGKLLDTAGLAYANVNSRVNSGELHGDFWGASYDVWIKNESGFAFNWNQFNNSDIDVMAQAINRWVKLIGNEPRQNGEGVLYEPNNILIEHANHLENVILYSDARASSGHMLVYPYNIVDWTTSTGGTNFVAIDWVDGKAPSKENWLTGDQQLWIINGLAMAGKINLAKELANRFYELRVKVVSNETDLLFYDRFDKNGKPLETDQSISIVFTALFMEAMEHIGDSKYSERAVKTLRKHQLYSYDSLLDGAYSWTVDHRYEITFDAVKNDYIANEIESDFIATIEEKSLGEIINAPIELVFVNPNAEEVLLNQQQNFNQISDKFSKVETTINQTNEEIKLKASKVEVESLDQRISETETSISQNAGEIALKANKTEVVEAIGNIKIGGVNMLSNTTTEWKTEAYHKGGGYGVYRGTSEVTAIYERALTEEIIISFEAKVDIEGNFQFYGMNNNPMYKASTVTLVGSTAWKKYSFPLKVERVEGGLNDSRIEFYGLDTRHVWVRKVKIELGNKATDYSEKPSDIEGRVMTNLNTSITQTNKAIELKASKTEVQTSIDKAVKDIQVGGRNLLLNTTDELFIKENYSMWYGSNIPDNQKTGELRFTILGDSGNIGVYSKDKINEPMKIGEKYVLSFYAYLETQENLSLDMNYNYLMTTDAGNIPFKSTGNIITKTKKKIEIPFEATKDASGYTVMIGTANNTLKGVNIVISKLKFEKGTKATDWTPSPEDENKYFKKLETAITQTSNELSFKASNTEVGGLTERMYVAEQKITPEAIVSTVTNDSGFNSVVEQKIDSWGVSVKDRLSAVETKVTPESITSTVTSSETFSSVVTQKVNEFGVTINDRLGTVETKVTPEAITSTVTGSEQFSTAITQKMDSWGVDVVKSGDVLATINASTEGVKIRGDLVDITGKVTFTSLDTTTQDMITGAEDLASTAFDTATSASSVANTASQNANTAYSLADSANSAIGSWRHPSNTTTIDGGKIFTGSISAYQLSATAIDGKVITGSTFRTSASATTDGVVMNSSGIYGYGGGASKFSLTNAGLNAVDAVITGRVTATEDSVFKGSISTGKDITVGNNIYMNYNYSERFNEKGIVMYQEGTKETSVKGTYLKMDITAPTINLRSTETIMVIHSGFRASGRAYLNSGMTVEGSVDFTNATVTGLTATFG